MSFFKFIRMLCLCFVVALGWLVAGSALAKMAQVKGSRVSLDPPAGYEPASRFAGFKNNATGGSILITELPPQVYAEMAKQFGDPKVAKKRFGERAVQIEAQRMLEGDGVKGMVFLAKQTVQGQVFKKWIVYLSNKAITAVVAIQAPEASAPEEAVVNRTISSIRIGEPPSIEAQLAELPFHLDVLEPFQIVRVIGGSSLLLTKGANDPAKIKEQPMMIIASSLRPVPEGVTKKAFAKILFDSMHGVNKVKITEETPINIGDASGYEIVAEAADPSSSENIKVVQWVRFAEQNYVRVVGISKPDQWESALPDFVAVRDGLKVGGR